MDQINTSVKKNSFKLFHECANALSDSPTSDILRSYYLIKCRTVAINNKLFLPQHFFNAALRCPRCCVLYQDGPASYCVQPEKKTSKFLRRLLRRKENDGSMTRCQERYLKRNLSKYAANACNTLVITCGVCKKQTEQKLVKPLKPQDTTNELESTSKAQKKKKKKKKDRYSGLNECAVLSTPHQKSLSINNSTPLEPASTPILSRGPQEPQRKKLFSNGHFNNSQAKSGKVYKTAKQVKEKKKNLKGLSNLLSDSSKQKKRTSTALKEFLTSI